MWGMTQKEGWPRIAVVGAGAVGCYFGGLLALAGAPVVLIGRKPLVEAAGRGGLVLDTLQFHKTVCVEASTELSAARGAGLVLFCVKTTDNADVALELAPYLDRGATVVSLQNGVDNTEQIRAAAQIDALPAAVYVGAMVPEPGRIKHTGRGDLVLGPECERTRWVAGVFGRAGVPCRISDNIDGELWTKLIANCALNAISALGQTRYGAIAGYSEARRLMRTAVEEVFAVASAAGVVLPGIPDAQAAIASAMRIAEQMPDMLSSTAQDINRRKATEIDSLNGYIARRGAELGVATPVNHALFTLVKLLETSGGEAVSRRRSERP